MAAEAPLSLETTRIVGLTTTRLGLGCWSFGGAQWGGQEDAESVATTTAAMAAGVTHFDTAIAYGGGRSESVLGGVLGDRGPDLFVASKRVATDTADEMVQAVDESRARLRRDCIDLYYIHWPRAGVDLRPAMEGLERCRAAGKIRAVGVSNFSCEQMDLAREVGTIDAHQFCYNLYWRFAEREIIPYLLAHRIVGVTYSSIAQGLLTGKFAQQPTFAADDIRPHTTLFDPAVYPHLWAATEQLRPLAEQCGRSLVELAIGWVLSQPGSDAVLVGARRPDQLAANLRAGQGTHDPAILDAMTAISDEACTHVPDTGNIFRYYP